MLTEFNKLFLFRSWCDLLGEHVEISSGDPLIQPLAFWVHVNKTTGETFWQRVLVVEQHRKSKWVHVPFCGIVYDNERDTQRDAEANAYWDETELALAIPATTKTKSKSL